MNYSCKTITNDYNTYFFFFLNTFLQRVRAVRRSWFVYCRSSRAPLWRASRSTCGRNGKSQSCRAVLTTSPPNRIRTWLYRWKIIAWCRQNGRRRSLNRRRWPRNTTTARCRSCSTRRRIMRRPLSNGTVTVWSTGT